MAGAGETGPLGDADVDALCARLRGYRALVFAVSGGGDSTALMHLVHEWNARRGEDAASLVAVTVDHGLRAEAASEACEVGRQAALLGIAHQTLRWSGTKPAAGLQAAAREARYTLLHGVAVSLGHAGEVAILTGHTSDDQAETFVMRLARGSGVDGLAAIPIVGRLVRPGHDGKLVAVPLIRPLLEVPRARLTATLAARGIRYSDDPSNRDIQFERVRVRQALDVLEGVGLGRVALARSARRMQAAKAALESATDALAQRAVTPVLGVVAEIDRAMLCSAPEEVGVRLLRRVLGRFGGAARPAELSAVEDAYQRLCGTEGERAPFTLGGCIVEVSRASGPSRSSIKVYRELDREGGVPSIRLEPGDGAIWDGRIWVEAGTGLRESVEFGPLGPDWARLVAAHRCLSSIAIPAGAARGLPAFRRGGEVLAAPLLVPIAAACGDAAAASALAGPQWPIAGPQSTPLLKAWVVEMNSFSEVSDP